MSNDAYKDKQQLRQKLLQTSHLNNETACRLWDGPKNEYGYGRVYFCGKRILAHRASYLVFKEEIPRGLVVLHRCDNTSCINPFHLFVGTHSDNTKDMWNKGRAAIGEANGSARLTEAQVFHMRKLFSTGKFVKLDLAKKFKISAALATLILTGKSWKQTFDPKMLPKNHRDIGLRGETKGKAKLNDKSVYEILTLDSLGKHTRCELAKIYKVDRSTITNILLGRYWKHIHTEFNKKNKTILAQD